KPSSRFLMRDRRASGKPETSSPRNRTVPSVGLSSNPRMCNKVLLPAPEAPVTDTKSPLARSKSRSRKSSMRLPVSVKTLATPRNDRIGSLMSYRLHGILSGRLEGRRQRGDAAQQVGQGEDGHHVEDAQVHRQDGDEVHVAGQADESELLLGPYADQAEDRADRRPQQPHHHAFVHEDAQDGPARRAHGAQDADPAGLVVQDRK